MSTNPKDKVGLTKPPLRFVPPALVIHASLAMADGAAKYGPFNWRDHTVSMNTYLEATERHLLALKDGENLTRDSRVHHMAAIAANCAIVLDALELGNLVDDRSTSGPAGDLIDRHTSRKAVADDLDELDLDEPIPFVPVEKEDATTYEPGWSEAFWRKRP